MFGFGDHIHACTETPTTMYVHIIQNTKNTILNSAAEPKRSVSRIKTGESIA